MRDAPPTPMDRARRNLIVVVVLLVVILSSGLAAAGPSPSPLRAPSAVGPGGHAATPTGGVGSVPPQPRAPHPLSTTPSYFGNTSGFAVPPFSQGGCRQSVSAGATTSVTDNCVPLAIDPTLMQLGNGDTAIAYEVNTNATGSSCAGAARNVTTAIGFATSTSGGTSFGAPTYLANTTCAYLEAIEPSFAATGDTVYGTFVEENDSTAFPGSYGDVSPRWNDALGFVKSSNNGASWSAAITLNRTGNIGHPELAAIGRSVYIVWENLSYNNATSVCSGGPFEYGACEYVSPIRLFFIDSTNGGATWSNPELISGLNATADYFSTGPSIAVNKTGTIGLSYFTNLTCAQYYVGCMDWALDLVVQTSASNGSTWSKISTVRRDVGISYSYNGYDYNLPPVQWLPQSQIIFSASGQSIDLTWSGLYNKTNAYVYDQWCCGGIFFGTGATGLTGWATSNVSTTFAEGSNYDDMFNPTIGLVGGTVYIAYTWNNETDCVNCSATEYLVSSYSEQLRWSTDDGVSWQGGLILQVAKMPPGCYTSQCGAQQFAGYSASMDTASSAGPLIAYALPGQVTSTFQRAGSTDWVNTTAPTNLSVSFPYTGSTVSVTINESGLPTGTPWSYVYQGITVYVNGTSTTITGVPSCQPVILFPGAVPGGYGEEFVSNGSQPGSWTFCTNTTITFSFTEAWQFLLFVNPSVVEDVYLVWTVGGVTYDYSNFYNCFGTCAGVQQWCVPTGCQTYPIPIYFPNGTRFTITTQSYYEEFVSYWNGTGAGGFTGVGLMANITMDGPVNETGWVGGFGQFNVSFAAPTLPSTSTYHFSFDGGNYSAAAGRDAVVPSVLTGAYPATNVWATSSTAGWEYFGHPNVTNPVVVPAELLVNFTFAYVDVGGATGVISFHAAGLTAGTVWRFAFNGTVYSSDAPYINVTEHSGTFPVEAFPVVSANGSAGYAPTGIGTTWSVTEGSSYTISFTSAYRVVASASQGGSISGTGHGTFWVAAGAAVQLKATAAPNFLFGGWAGTGLGSYTGTYPWANVTVDAPITESAIFLSMAPAHYNLTVQASGLAPGTWWTVYLSGAGYSTDQATLVIPGLNACGAAGTYTLSVPYAYVNGTNLTRFVPGTYPHTICTNGQTVLSLTFTPEYFLTLEATNGGVAEATVGALATLSSTWVTRGQTAQLSASANSPFVFLGWNGTGPGSYTGTIADSPVIVNNPLTEIAAFGTLHLPPPVRYWLDLHLAVALAPGTAWSVTLGGIAYSATGADLNITGLKTGPYALTVPRATSPDGLTEYAALAPPPSITVAGNRTVTISYAASFWVTTSASVGGLVRPISAGWVSDGTLVALSAPSETGYDFIGWHGIGVGNYSGTEGNVSIKVGGPVSEVAGYAAIPPTIQASISPSVWSASTTWIAFAAVGLLIGIAVGLLVLGRRREPPSYGIGPMEPVAAPADEVPTGDETMSPGPESEGGEVQ